MTDREKQTITEKDVGKMSESDADIHKDNREPKEDKEEDSEIESTDDDEDEDDDDEESEDFEAKDED